jgi:hypothetical protein
LQNGLLTEIITELNKMYRIAWRVIATNYVGYGDYCLSFENARDWVDAMNKKHPDTKHWMEEDK